MTNTFSHSQHAALELEFYIPAAVWEHPGTERFLAAVYALVEGATVLGGAKGVWRGQAESTNLVRVVVRESEVRLGEVLSAVHREIDKVMETWDASPRDRQDAFMFTVRRLTVHDTVRSPRAPREGTFT